MRMKDISQPVFHNEHPVPENIFSIRSENFPTILKKKSELKIALAQFLLEIKLKRIIVQ